MRWSEKDFFLNSSGHISRNCVKLMRSCWNYSFSNNNSCWNRRSLKNNSNWISTYLNWHSYMTIYWKLYFRYFKAILVKQLNYLRLAGLARVKEKELWRRCSKCLFGISGNLWSGNGQIQIELFMGHGKFSEQQQRQLPEQSTLLCWLLENTLEHYCKITLNKNKAPLMAPPRPIKPYRIIPPKMFPLCAARVT